MAMQELTLPAGVRPLAILVVEDTPVNQKLATHLLARFGYDADVAAGGEEALRALTARAYDLVLMDVQMPDMDGLEATRCIRERWPHRDVRIVAMTGNVAEEDLLRCQAAGMDGFLGKPLLPESLAVLLRETAARVGAGSGPALPGQRKPLLAELGEQLGQATVRELADEFVVAVEACLAELNDGCRDRDRLVVARTAHRLKGSANNFGLDDLGEQFGDLEERSSYAGWPELSWLTGQITALWDVTAGSRSVTSA